MARKGGKGKIYFNPLHHEGGDERFHEVLFHICYFNPLHHEGGDLDGAEVKLVD